MVAKVISGKTIRGVLSYNENKVKEGMAICLSAVGFRDEISKLSFRQKLDTFVRYQEKNERTKANTVHISLNFDKGDRLTTDKLKNIASAYIDKIGFGQQPFLVYQHFDAAHPHLHIVTTNIRTDGSRIALHNIGRNQSEKARKEIEDEFRLITAQGRKYAETQIKAVDLERATYGKSETKRSITNIVNTVVKTYKFASIHEFNAVLKQYNILADRGAEGTHMREKNGLQYTIIDTTGRPIGIPIKASSIYGQPTMANLSRKFQENEQQRIPHKERLIQIIDGFCDGHKLRFTDFTKGLALNNIYTVVRQNNEGRIYGLTFIDNQTKCVFNGSDLGKQYSAKGLLERLDGIPTGHGLSTPAIPTRQDVISKPQSAETIEGSNDINFELLNDLMAAKMDNSAAPYELRKRKRKRGRRL